MNNLAFVFPGQGSQSVGMLAEMAERYSVIKDTFSVVSDKLGLDLWQLVQAGPSEQLNQTENTQVAMLTADVAVFNLLKKMNVHTARWMAGHSLGEYAALVCASAISLPEAASLVAKRGELMQKTVPLGLGAMAAIVGLTDEQVTRLCVQACTANEFVTPANFNAIGQVVIAGHTQAIERALKLAEEQEARLAKIIPVSVPCHCPLLMEAADAFSEFLAAAPFNEPAVSVISNVDLSIYKTPDQIRLLLKEQLYKPVRWVETIQKLHAQGIETVIECGPAKVLNGLVKRIEKSISTYSVNDNASLEQVLSLYTVQENYSR